MQGAAMRQDRAEKVQSQQEQGDRPGRDGPAERSPTLVHHQEEVSGEREDCNGAEDVADGSPRHQQPGGKRCQEAAHPGCLAACFPVPEAEKDAGELTEGKRDQGNPDNREDILH